MAMKMYITDAAENVYISDLMMDIGFSTVQVYSVVPRNYNDTFIYSSSVVTSRMHEFLRYNILPFSC